MNARTHLMSTALLLAGAALAPAASAVTIDFGNCAADDGSGFTTCVAGATVDTYDAPVLAQYFGDGAIVSGSVSGRYATPAGDATSYVTVPEEDSSGALGVWFGGKAQDYFGLYWGSMDAYNSLTFYRNGTEVAGFGGSDVIAAANLLGNQTAAGSNRYVNFWFAPGEGFDAVVFRSDGYAFEFDNVAWASLHNAVPEPTTVALLCAALVCAGLAGRPRRALARRGA